MGGNLMNVVIAFLGTAKYLNFLPHYYENIEQYFLPNTKKTILVFTDGEIEGVSDNIIPYYQEHLPWPLITLKRFEIINKAKDIIKDHDLFVFIDADALPVTTITEEEFFVDKPLFGVQHPCHFLKMKPHDQYPGAWDQNPKSLAYVNTEEEKPKIYFQGCLWGGKVPEVCDMIDELERRVNRDIENQVTALWHDESHINKYFLERISDVHVFSSEYSYPEVFSEVCTFEPKIVHLRKDNSKYHT
jgi:hypothetical protein